MNAPTVAPRRLPGSSTSFHPSVLLVPLAPLALLIQEWIRNARFPAGAIDLGATYGPALLLLALTSILAAQSRAWWPGLSAGRLSKEIRPLIPACLLAIAVPWVVAFFDVHDVFPLSWGFYTLGCTLIGASLFGAEIDQRTLGLLLVQPQSRNRIWWTKIALGAWLLLLAALSQWFARRGAPVFNGTSTAWELRLTFGIPALALCTGPILSLWLANTLPATIASIALPIVLWLGGLSCIEWITPTDDLLVQAARGNPAAQVSRIQLVENRLFVFYSLAYPAYALLLGWMGWRTFLRFDAVDASRPVRSTATTDFMGHLIDRLLGFLLPKRPWAALVRKELRLHTLPWFVAALSVVFWVLFQILRFFQTDGTEIAQIIQSPALPILCAVLCGVATIIVTGAAAIAEDRHNGTLDWQLTFPSAIRRQWRIKAWISYLLIGLLGIYVPYKISTSEAPQEFWNQGPMQVRLMMSIGFTLSVLLGALALYASSLSRQTVKAAIATVPLAASVAGAFFGSAALWFPFIHRYINNLTEELKQGMASPLPFRFNPQEIEVLIPWIVGFVPILLALTVLALTRRNFRRGIPSTASKVRQVIGILTCAAVFFSFAASVALGLADIATRSMHAQQGFGATEVHEVQVEAPEPAQVDGVRRTTLAPVAEPVEVRGVPDHFPPPPPPLPDNAIPANPDATPDQPLKPGAAAGPQQFQMDPVLARRYGLQIQQLPEGAGGAAPVPRPVPVQMDPVLARRYGLQVQQPANQTQPPPPTPLPVDTVAPPIITIPPSTKPIPAPAPPVRLPAPNPNN